jgi:hypothetical protein
MSFAAANSFGRFCKWPGIILIFPLPAQIAFYKFYKDRDAK